MNTTTRTTVSKSSPRIKAIIARTFGHLFAGRKVTVCEVSPTWESTQYVDDHSVWILVNLETLELTHIPRPTYGSTRHIHAAPSDGCALVTLVRYPGSPDSIEIVIGRRSVAADLEIAADALEAKQPKRALEVIQAALAQDEYANAAYDYAGILLAVAEGARKVAAAAATKAAKKAEFLGRTVWA